MTAAHDQLYLTDLMCTCCVFESGDKAATWDGTCMGSQSCLKQPVLRLRRTSCVVPPHHIMFNLWDPDIIPQACIDLQA